MAASFVVRTINHHSFAPRPRSCFRTYDIITLPTPWRRLRGAVAIEVNSALVPVTMTMRYPAILPATSATRNRWRWLFRNSRKSSRFHASTPKEASSIARIRLKSNCLARRIRTGAFKGHLQGAVQALRAGGGALLVARIHRKGRMLTLSTSIRILAYVDGVKHSIVGGVA